MLAPDSLKFVRPRLGHRRNRSAGKSSPRKRLSYIEISTVFFLIAGILLLMIIAAISGSLSLTDLLPLLLGVVIILVLARYTDLTGLVMAIMILATAVSEQFWLDNRILIYEFPISVPDILILTYAVYGVVKFISGGFPRLGGVGLFLLLWFFYNSCVGLIMGFQQGNTFYGVLQEYRLVLYTAAAYLTTVTIFNQRRHLSVAVWCLLGTGIIVSTWQLIITLLGSGTSQAVAIAMKGGIGRNLRDVNLPLYFAGFALVALVMLQIWSPTILGRARRWTWLLIPIFLGAMALSMTRTVWVSLILSIGLVGVSFIRAGHFFRTLVMTLALAAAIVTSYFVVQKYLPTVYQSMESTWNHSLSSTDSTYYGRLETMSLLTDYMIEDNQVLLSGIGFGNMWSGSAQSGPYFDLHNTYLAYMVIGGLPGMLLFLALWTSPLIIYLRLLYCPLDQLSKAYVIAATINWVVMSILFLAMPPHWAESAFLGITLGIASVLERTYLRKRLATLVRPMSRELVLT